MRRQQKAVSAVIALGRSALIQVKSTRPPSAVPHFWGRSGHLVLWLCIIIFIIDTIVLPSGGEPDTEEGLNKGPFATDICCSTL